MKRENIWRMANNIINFCAVDNDYIEYKKSAVFQHRILKTTCAYTNNYIKLEATHIWPRSHRGKYMPSNVISICRDIHWVFNKGVFTIDDDIRVMVRQNIQSEYLGRYNKQKNYLPEDFFFILDINNLHYHKNYIYGLFNYSESLTKAARY